MKYLIIGSFFLTALHIALADDLIKQKVEKFSILTPNDFAIKKLSPVEDFDIYSIGKNGRPYVSIYLGNHPSFPRNSAGTGETITTFKTDNVQIISIQNNGKLAKKEILIKLTTQGWPGYIHAWIIDDLTPTDIKMADDILMSIDTQTLNTHVKTQ